MTTEVLTVPSSKVIDGVGPYPVAIPYSQSALQCFVTRSDGSVVILPAADFTVSPAESDDGGSITLSTSAAITYHSATLDIRRSDQAIQGWAGKTPREKALQDQLDALTRSVQDLQERAGRSAQVPPSSSLTDVFLPAPSPNSVIVGNADGTAFEGRDVLGDLTQALDGLSDLDLAVKEAQAAVANTQTVFDLAVSNTLFRTKPLVILVLDNSIGATASAQAAGGDIAKDDDIKVWTGATFEVLDPANGVGVPVAGRNPYQFQAAKEAKRDGWAKPYIVTIAEAGAVIEDFLNTGNTKWDEVRPTMQAALAHADLAGQDIELVVFTNIPVNNGGPDIDLATFEGLFDLFVKQLRAEPWWIEGTKIIVGSAPPQGSARAMDAFTIDTLFYKDPLIQTVDLQDISTGDGLHPTGAENDIIGPRFYNTWQGKIAAAVPKAHVINGPYIHLRGEPLNGQGLAFQYDGNSGIATLGFNSDLFASTNTVFAASSLSFLVAEGGGVRANGRLFSEGYLEAYDGFVLDSRFPSEFARSDSATNMNANLKRATMFHDAKTAALVSLDTSTGAERWAVYEPSKFITPVANPTGSDENPSGFYTKETNGAADILHYTSEAALITDEKLNYDGNLPSRVAVGGLVMVGDMAYEFAGAAAADPDRIINGPNQVKLYETGTRFTSYARLQKAVTRGLRWPEGAIVRTPHAEFVSDPASTALSDLPTLKPRFAGVSPAHFGGVPGYDTDATAAVQAAFDLVETTYDTDLNAFTHFVDFQGDIWRITSECGSTNTRQPFFKVGNGTIFAANTSGIGVTLAGTNQPHIIEPFSIESPLDPDNCPEVCFLLSRAEFNGNPEPIAPSVSVKIRMEGCASKAMMANFGSEVSNIEPHITNAHPSEIATSYYGCGNMNSWSDHFGAPLTSTLVTLPTEADGDFSNILHSFGPTCEFKRRTDYNAVITGITQTNPAVVSFAASTSNAAKLANGQQIYLTNINGMSELNYTRQTIANLTVNVDGDGGTFELQDLDSTGLPAFSRTALFWRVTGPAFIGARIDAVDIGPQAYALSYGCPPILLDLRRGNLAKFSFEGQVENSPNEAVEFNVGDQNAVIQGFKLDLLSRGQQLNAPYKLTGAGTIRFDGNDLSVRLHDGPMPDGICANASRMTIRDGWISTPEGCDLSGLNAFHGVERVMEPHTIKWHGVQLDNVVGSTDLSAGDTTVAALLLGSAAELTSQGLRAAGGGIRTYPLDQLVERPLLYQAIASTEHLEDPMHPINRINKFFGKTVFSSSFEIPLYASGGSPGDTWKRFTDNTVAHDPSLNL